MQKFSYLLENKVQVLCSVLKLRGSVIYMKSKIVSHSVVCGSLQAHGLWPVRLLYPWDSPGKNIGVDCHVFLQVIFLTQESNPGFLHCRQVLYCLSHQASPAWFMYTFDELLQTVSSMSIKYLCFKMQKTKNKVSKDNCIYMCVSACVYICVCAYICTYVYVYVYVYICVYTEHICIYVCICTYTCIYVYICVYICVHVYIHVFIYIQDTYVYVYVYVYVCVYPEYIWICLCVCIHRAQIYCCLVTSVMSDSLWPWCNCNPPGSVHRIF